MDGRPPASLLILVHQVRSILPSFLDSELRQHDELYCRPVRCEHAHELVPRSYHDLLERLGGVCYKCSLSYRRGRQLQIHVHEAKVVMEPAIQSADRS